MKKRKLLLSGGGTGGSVTPLLAIVEQARLKKLSYEFFWAGTAHGPERHMVENYGIIFFILPAGKWRRYWDWRNVAAPFLVAAGFLKSIWLLQKLHPDAVLTAGGFVSVPLVWASWCLRIPVTVHEQDVERGLANKLMSPFASLKTSVWPGHDKNSVVIGNLVRPSVLNGNPLAARRHFQTGSDLSLVLVMGGGTGALALNRLIIEALPFLAERVLLIHLTGAGKQISVQPSIYYHQQAFARAELPDFYAAAEVVVSRAGMGTISELACLGKAAIVIPIPDSHQEANAQAIAQRGAAIVLEQINLTANKFAQEVLNLVNNQAIREHYGRALHELIADGSKQFLEHLETIFIN
ncbi:hypothetical protein A3H10_01210 [Candidatus Uhrbacteria bacterium RIFCSPLOWO2_12_FULL_46_10]|uniref:UDP-N-acetylglucosamine--N-acetylmuramyl-(pentapeptide) pyrophosphoryl-undecaprenol N-acetylglucosamine transferase n=1 Tax=Candidatus Uhrbacteria bacterium RIFCSPLOWO2_01_FULL_47_25 TaxID=1802402 RepID=A0A1F7UPI6_9BACT|nr:MAG: hypothetical protein UX68_C0019G0018 [Parcubacteria group bacterium GW2011_GWA2_46_9]OGL59208.1 MAG: hypothetical protein A2752_01880 [Candidatus Uhrbacteria bacterium RIFCSPHIGHO2_01_FULL_46_23]OGL69160.1 MAG: hypothetical protein A3D60_04645 [Candidatus Uhrbacteria bacterium RIFCSPHIGHO2_02_FULL_47_29]OGL75559.1 MAG: hypothetical protein A3E96_02985 [Candidatus Uhrbacteria bacterium RIFCSPHIGHO2_12_FULL_46_13]OGL80223.1 MAG: hypothetical protein A2936_02550 [Candidatus Uhrbacteria bac